MVYGNPLPPAMKAIPASWIQRETPVFLVRPKKSSSALLQQLTVVNQWLAVPCVVHIVDRDDVMIKDANDARAFFQFLAPLLVNSSALEEMARDGHLLEVKPGMLQKLS